jgi:hypothetical protein
MKAQFERARAKRDTSAAHDLHHIDDARDDEQPRFSRLAPPAELEVLWALPHPPVGFAGMPLPFALFVGTSYSFLVLSVTCCRLLLSLYALFRSWFILPPILLCCRL